MATVVIIGECTQGLVFMLERYLVEFQQHAFCFGCAFDFLV